MLLVIISSKIKRYYKSMGHVGDVEGERMGPNKNILLEKMPFLWCY